MFGRQQQRRAGEDAKARSDVGEASPLFFFAKKRGDPDRLLLFFFLVAPEQRGFVCSMPRFQRTVLGLIINREIDDRSVATKLLACYTAISIKPAFIMFPEIFFELSSSPPVRAHAFLVFLFT